MEIVAGWKDREDPAWLGKLSVSDGING